MIRWRILLELRICTKQCVLNNYKEKKITILRVDFSSRVGLGHLKRQEAFIQRMESGEWRIICKECDKNLTKLPIIKIKDEKEFFEKVKELKPKEVIIDNYNFSYEEEKEFKKLFPKIKLIVFDDTYEKHFCDEIINHNLGAKKDKYENPEIVRIIKPLIRSEFYKAKKKRVKKDGIFISLGGSDAKGLTLKVLKLLKPMKIRINLYVTSANQNLEKIKKFAFLNRWINLYINEDVAEGMAKSEFGIITPSTIAYEAMFMNLDFLAIQVAKNQDGLAKILKRKYKILKDNEIKKIPKIVRLKNENRKV